MPGYTNPAQATSDALQQILAEQRLQARQKMQDDLNAQNVQSEIRDRDSNAAARAESVAASAEQRKAFAELREQMKTDAKIKNYGDIPIQNLSPDDTAFLKQNAPGRIQTGGMTLPSSQAPGAGLLVGAPQTATDPTASPSTSTAPALPPGQMQANPSTFSPNVPGNVTKDMGSPAYQQQQAQIQRTNDALSKIPGLDPNIRTLSGLLLANPALAGLAEKVMTSKNEKPGHFFQRDRQGNLYDTGLERGPNDAVVPPEPAPVKEPAERFMIAGNDDAGNALWSSDLKPGLFDQYKNPYYGTLHPATNKPVRTPLVKPPKVSDPSWNRLSAATNNVIKHPDDPAAEQELQAQANIIAQQMGTPADIRDGVLARFRKRKLLGMNPGFDGTDAQVTAAKDLWSALTGGFQQVQ